MVDFGYDISDYRDISPIFGTMADFDALAARLKQAGKIPTEIQSLNKHTGGTIKHNIEVYDKGHYPLSI